MTENYRSTFKGSTRLNLGKDTSCVTQALVSHIRMSAMNLIAYSAMDKEISKNRSDLMNLLGNLQTLDSFTIKYNRVSGELYVGVEGTISIELSDKKPKRKR